MTQAPGVKAKGDNVHVGLGWHIERCNQEPVLNHGGGMLGYTAQVLINPGRRCGTVVLSNLGNHLKWQTRIYGLSRDLLTGLHAPDLILANSG